MVVWLDIETRVIGKGGAKRGWMGGWDGWRNRYGCCCILCPLCMFGCIFNIVVEGACVKDCMGLGLCTVG
jgi:hypothetical protein